MKLNKLLSKQDLDKVTLILSHSSSAIEGNTFTLNETKKLFEGNIDSIKDKNLKEIYELQNNKEAIEYIFNNFNVLKINNDTIKTIHKITTNNLLVNNCVFRTHNVRITNSNVLPYDWTVVEYKLNKLNDWFNEEIIKNTNKEDIILEYHVRFEKIHPFTDGNGRTGRLLILLMQFQNNLEFKYFDNSNRIDYIKGLDEFRLTGSLIKLKSVFQKEVDLCKDF